MDILFIFISITLANLVAWLTPGPNTIAVINQSITHGRQSGILTGLGLSAGSTLWAALAVIGVEALFELFPGLIFSLRIVGAGYLLWIGIKTLFTASTEDGAIALVNSSKRSAVKAFLHGFVVVATNPKAAFFYGSIITSLVPNNASSSLLGAIVFLCGILAVICHSITATVFSSDAVIQRFNRMRRKVSLVFGIVFSGIGISVAYHAIRNR